MAMPALAGETTLEFDDRHIQWVDLGADNPLLKDVEAYVFEVDEDNRTVDILFRFAPHSRITLHRHLASYRTLILQGELRIYDADDNIKEIRPVGSYVLTQANGPPHREGGGDQAMVALFSNRNIRPDGGVYDLLDDDGNSLAVLGIEDFKAILAAQEA